MPLNIAARAITGAKLLVTEADTAVKRMLAESGPRARVSFPGTSYYLPTVLAMSGKAIETVGDFPAVTKSNRQLLHRKSAGPRGAPGLVRAQAAGLAALQAAEALEAGRFTFQAGDGGWNGPIDDVHARAWGISLADGRMPGVALILGCAKSSEVAARIVRELHDRNILCLLSGNVKGRGVSQQLRDAGVELGYESHIVPLGPDTTSAVHGLGFAARCALMLGGLLPGMSEAILGYTRERIPGFVLALGQLDDRTCAIAAGASNFGFAFVADTEIPTRAKATAFDSQVVCLPFDSIEARDDQERAVRLVEKCIAARGLRIKTSRVDIPVKYGHAFDDQEIAETELLVDFGGHGSCAFEYLQTGGMNEVTDGKVDVLGPDLPTTQPHTPANLGIVVQVAGSKMQADFEPVLERQIHGYMSAVNGVEHNGKRDRIRIRVANEAAAHGLNLHSFGKILEARMREEFGSVVEKVQVAVITEPEAHADWLQRARLAFQSRDRQMAQITDDKVDEFYSCGLCRTFAPGHVCIVSPERVSPCGEHNWLDCRASFMINPAGPHQPIRLGKRIDADKGIWEGTNDYIRTGSRGSTHEVSMYSIMQKPLTACACFECIVMLIPEANGVMVVSQEDPSITPAGLTFSALAGIVTSGQQTPGVMGVAKAHLTSPRFISADGGFKRVVWMSSVLKDSMAEELKAVCEREGDPALMDRIADEKSASSVEGVLAWMRAHQHPALAASPMF